MTDHIRYANEELIIKIIDTYEDLERALKSGESDELRRSGIIYQNLKNLRKEGLEEIPKGEKFDPFKHEALLTEDHEDFKNGEIIKELCKGYKLNSKVIKYSKVQVCKKNNA